MPKKTDMYLVEYGEGGEDTTRQYYVVDQADDVYHAIEQAQDAANSRVRNFKVFAVYNLHQVY